MKKKLFKTLFIKFDDHVLCVKREDLTKILTAITDYIMDEETNGVYVSMRDIFMCDYAYKIEFNSSIDTWAGIVEGLMHEGYRLTTQDETENLYVEKIET